MKAQCPKKPLIISPNCFLHNHIPDWDKDVASLCEWEVLIGDLHLQAGRADDV